ALGLVAVLGAGACGSSSTSPSASSGASSRPSAVASTPASVAPTASEEPTRAPILSVSPDQLIFPDRLLICSDLPYQPMRFFDDSGVPTGADVDLGTEIAARLGLEAVIVNSISETILAAVNAGKCDIIMSTMTITAERKEQVDFITYFQAGQSFVVATGNPENIHTQEDLCGKSIAAQTGTVEVDYLQGTGAYEKKGLSAACESAGLDAIDVQTYQKDSDALLALQSGQVSAYFADSPVAGFYVAQHPDSFELSGLSLGVAKQGIAVPKEKPELKAQVQRALGTMVRDGAYIAILEKYGVADGNVFNQ
ncbi:MAG: ABC transporter substrate-binding protein, partial [Chloroflexi bacterium]|nr:ABC transporter substrate-binding protein [Chloroflexota bacterium]